MGLHNLLNDTDETFYWLGFILADGHISKNNRLRVRLSEKDFNHLKKLGSYLGCEVTIYKNQACLIIQNKKIISEFKNKFNISNNKTYNPPPINTFKNFNIDLLLSMLVGFIDGDGCIKYQTGRSDSILAIKNHQSWLDFLIFFHDMITNQCGITFPSPKIDNNGYATLHCCNLKILQYLKAHTLKCKLPILNRKWEKIDMNRISRYENAKNNKLEVLKLWNDGYRQRDIVKKVNLSPSRVCMIIKNNS